MNLLTSTVCQWTSNGKSTKRSFFKTIVFTFSLACTIQRVSYANEMIMNEEVNQGIALTKRSPQDLQALLSREPAEFQRFLLECKEGLLQFANSLSITLKNAIVGIAKEPRFVSTTSLEPLSPEQILANPQATPATQRDNVFAWITHISERLTQITETLNAMPRPQPNQLKQISAVLTAYLDALYIGVRESFVQSKRTLPTNAEIAAIMKGYTERARKEMELEEVPLTPEGIDIVVLENALYALRKGFLELSQKTHEYGLSPFNQAMRTLDLKLRKGWNYKYTPIFALIATVAGSALLAKIAYNKLAEWKWGTKEEFAKDTARHFSYRSAETLVGVLFGFGMNQWKSVRNMLLKGWRHCKGEHSKDKVGDFDLIKREDCIGKEEPLIGLKAPFARVMASVESALTRMRIGEREPFKGVQRTFIFVGASGAGKTFLADQLKLRIASLRENLGIDIAYESIGAIGLAFGDLLARIQEAQKRNIGLVLWVDELHLMKPHKDGTPTILEQLLQTEIVNKSNTPIWIFAATNEPGRFDNALIRAGRFEVINIYQLTFTDRVEFFEYYLKEHGLTLSQNDIHFLASQTHGVSPATLSKAINAARMGGKLLTKELILHEIQRLVFRMVPGFEDISRNEQIEVAVYQSGKALVHMLNLQKMLTSNNLKEALQTGQRFVLVTASAIEKPIQELAAYAMSNVVVNPNLAGPRRSFGKVFTFDGREELSEKQNSQGKKRAILELVAGSRAQQETLGYTVDPLSRDDMHLAHEYCLELARNGRAPELMSRAEQERTKAAAEALLQEACDQATELIRQHQTALGTMVFALVENPAYPSLYGTDIAQILEQEEAQGHKKAEAQAAEKVPVAQ